MLNLSPIVLFVYNRPEHTRQTLDALAANFLASESDLFIYSDAPKNQEAVESVQAVRSLIKNVQGFKSVTIIEREKNWGLANSIIDGVTNIVNQYGKIVVLEDDIVTSPYFLQFMNDALSFYENEKKVWNITGYQFPINSDKLPNAFLSCYRSCWSWGTWADRWKYFDKNPDKYISQITKKKIYRFNFYGTNDMFSQITANKEGKLNTWAIFWYAEIFINNGFTLFPGKSLANNTGMDGSGVHCGRNNNFDNVLENDPIGINFNEIPLEDNKLATKLICDYLAKTKPKIYKRILSLCKKNVKRFINMKGKQVAFKII
jgi:hypothetical protein